MCWNRREWLTVRKCRSSSSSSSSSVISKISLIKLVFPPSMMSALHRHKINLLFLIDTHTYKFDRETLGRCVFSFSPSPSLSLLNFKLDSRQRRRRRRIRRKKSEVNPNIHDRYKNQLLSVVRKKRRRRRETTWINRVLCLERQVWFSMTKENKKTYIETIGLLAWLN